MLSKKKFSGGIVHADEKICEALPRAVFSLVNEIRDDLSRPDPNDAVRAKVTHDVRRKIKRARALVRLVEDQLPKRDFVSLDRPLREVKNLFGSMRDSDVVSSSLHELRAKLPKSAQDLETVARAENARQEKLELFVRRSRRARLLIHQVVITPFRIQGSDRIILRAGLQESYRAARKAARRAQRTNEVEDLHRLRKKAKVLQYQVDSLAELLPEAAHSYRGKLRVLNRRLGKDHDLTLVSERAKKKNGVGGRVSRKVRSTIDEIRHRSLEGIKVSASDLFCDKPERFTQKLLSGRK